MGFIIIFVGPAAKHTYLKKKKSPVLIFQILYSCSLLKICEVMLISLEGS